MQTQPDHTHDSQAVVAGLREALSDFMTVEDITILDSNARPLIRFGGQLVADPDDGAFDDLVTRFKASGLYADPEH